jgi:hypothetical protein
MLLHQQWQGLAMASRLGCNRVLAEFDSTEIIEACLGVETWWSESVAIFADCIDTVISIESVSFKHCLREINKATHVIASECFSSKRSGSWEVDSPSFLLKTLLNDVIPL